MAHGKFPKLWRGPSPEGEARARQLRKSDAPFLSASGPGFRTAKMKHFSEVITEDAPPALVTCNPIQYTDFDANIRSTHVSGGPFIKRIFGRPETDVLTNVEALSSTAGAVPPCVGMGYGMALFSPIFAVAGGYELRLASWSGQRSMTVYGAGFAADDIGQLGLIPFGPGWSGEGENYRGLAGVAAVDATGRAWLNAVYVNERGDGIGSISGALPFAGTPLATIPTIFWTARGVRVVRVGPADLVAMYALLYLKPEETPGAEPTLDNAYTQYYLAVSRDNGVSWSARTISMQELESGVVPAPEILQYDFAAGRRCSFFCATRFDESRALLAYQKTAPGVLSGGFTFGTVCARLNLNTLTFDWIFAEGGSAATQHTATLVTLFRLGDEFVLQQRDEPVRPSEPEPDPWPGGVPRNGIVRRGTNGSAWSDESLPWPSWRTGTITAIGADELCVPVYVEEPGFTGDRIFRRKSGDSEWRPSARIGRTPAISAPTVEGGNTFLRSYNGVIAVRDSLGRELAPTPGAPWMSDSRFPAPWES